MSNLGKLVGAMIILSLAGGIFYIYGNETNLFTSGYKVKVTSNCEWGIYIKYQEAGEERIFAKINISNNKTYEFEGKLVSVSAFRSVEWFQKTTNAYLTVQIYQRNKLIWEKTTTKYDDLNWLSGVREG